MTLAWLAAAWLAGTVSAAMLGLGAWPLALALAAFGLALGALRRSRAAALFAVALAVVFAGAVARFESARTALPAHAISRFNDGVSTRFRGVVDGDPRLRDTSQQLSVRVREVQVEGAWREASGGVLVTTGLVPRRGSGDLIEVEGKLETPASSTNFDYADYLERRGIASTIAFPYVRLIGHADNAPLKATVLAVRRRLSHALALALPDPQASLAQSVLLGERSALPSDISSDLNATNTSHLVVVSGANVVLVSTFVTVLLAWAIGRRRALALSIAAVLAYAMLVGGSAPVMRATMMGVLLVVARLNGRPTHGLTSILLAAAIMAGIDPGVTRDVSFQLSFAATAGIVYLASPLQSGIIALFARALRRDEVPRFVGSLFAEPLAVTLAAIIATEPLIALNFGRLSLVGVAAHLLIVPAFPFILLATLLAALGGLVPHLHLALAAPAYYLLTYWLVVARELASIPHAAPGFGGYTTTWAMATYTIVTVAAFAVLRRLRPGGTSHLAESRAMHLGTPAILAAVEAVLLAGSAAVVLWSRGSPRLRVTVFDVGQGDAILIRTPGGRDVLVDGGPGRAVLRGLGQELPWHDRDIELMVLTHPQADHLTGLLDVLDRYDVRSVLVGPGQQQSAGSMAWTRALSAEGAPVATARAGMRIELGDGAWMDVLGPDASMANAAELNNTGVVVRVRWGDVSFLLTADIEAKAEAALLAGGADLRATVLKVAHHGSETSSTQRFVDAVRPQVSVVSAGKDNAFGHPRADVVARLREYGEVYVTALDGGVRFETDGKQLWVHTAR